MRNKAFIFAWLIAWLLLARSSSAEPGILLLAHGGSAEWNARVGDLVARIDAQRPTEVAFGMATRANIQGAIDRLVARGASEIIAVPLFVSSWSSVITSTEYLLGLRADAPPELMLFANMNHSSHGAPSGAPHTAPPAARSAEGPSHASAGGHHHGGHVAVHDGHAAVGDATTPIVSPVPVRMTPALNGHRIVAEILASRALTISRDPAAEAAIIVAHGPNEEDYNQKWLADMRALAEGVAEIVPFASIDYLTLRDDAPAPVRDQATAELRNLVETHLGKERRVLILPLLISLGGIDRGLRERLEGLSYSIPEAALLPDDRLVTWVLAMADGR